MPVADSSALLAGKVTVVTGAGRGVGRGIALELARAGAVVVVNDPTAESVIDRVLPMFANDFYPLHRSGDVFTWDPI